MEQKVLNIASNTHTHKIAKVQRKKFAMKELKGDKIAIPPNLYRSPGLL